MLRFIKLNPASILFAVNAVVAMAVAYGAHLSTDQTGAITAIVTAVLTIFTAATTRPVGLQVILGGVTAIATALATFGLHLTSAQIGTGVTVLSIVLAGIFHLAHVPVAAAKQGTTADALQGVRTGGPAR
jgi:hypothetical protein